jgi:murein peptide amidase A
LIRRSISVGVAFALIMALGLRFASSSAASGRVFLGHSVQGRPIIAIELGSPRAARTVLVFGCIHGDECAGITIAKRLAQARAPLGVDLWIVPNLNPDGFALATRQNAHGVDLNRNFSWRWRPSAVGSMWYSGPSAFSEPESRIARDLILRLNPTITIWFHTRRGPNRPALVDQSGGNRAIERRYARLVGYPLGRYPRYPGSAASWGNHKAPGTTSFAVELPYGRTLTAREANRHSSAILKLALNARPPS